MLNVLTPEEVFQVIEKEFKPLLLDESSERENDSADALKDLLGKILLEDIIATEHVPDFDRSTVDGYAVRARDTFGCSEAIPVILRKIGSVQMGKAPEVAVTTDTCVAIPTGGALPEGADCAVMVEHTEDYGDGTIGILKSAAPGQNLIFRGDDTVPGDVLLPAGKRLTASDIGALAALGITTPKTRRNLKVAVISTGDELVLPSQIPGPGQVRDVNTPLLAALLKEWGYDAEVFEFVRDDENELRKTVQDAALRCDAVVISGGSSVGQKDAACRVIESMGTLLMHGIAIKPGKPTILGKSSEGKPLVGLPGHPAAAYFIARTFVHPLLARLAGEKISEKTVSAILAESVNANHGRAQITPCRLEKDGDKLYAIPIRSKSGLITQLARADGFFMISRDCEGLPKGAEVSIILN